MRCPAKPKHKKSCGCDRKAEKLIQLKGPDGFLHAMKCQCRDCGAMCGRCSELADSGRLWDWLYSGDA